MTEEEKAAAEAAAKTTTFTQADIDAAVEAATAGLKAKNGELLSETKAEREKRTALELQQTEADAERQKKAGEWQELHNKSEAALKTEREANAAFRGQIAKRDVDAAASGIASELTRDTKRAALIAKEVAAFAKSGENGVTYEIGGVAVDRAKIIEQITADYPFLVDGNQSHGGGADGGGGGAGKDLKDLGDAERLKLAREGKLRPK